MNYYDYAAAAASYEAARELNPTDDICCRCNEEIDRFSKSFDYCSSCLIDISIEELEGNDDDE